MSRTRPENLNRARHLRQHPTAAETLLWGHLRRGQFAGHRFRRQHRIGPYFVDFVCRRSNLAIELDGSQHDDRQQYDRRRDKYIRSKGYRVIRVGNEEVFENLDGVLEAIALALVSGYGEETLPPQSLRDSSP